MLEQALFLLFINPAFPDSGELYDAGLNEVEHHYFSDKPAKDYPLINITLMAQDYKQNVIKPGMYYTDLSRDNKNILLFQGTEIVGESPVVQYLEFDEAEPVPTAKIGIVKNNIIVIVYKKGNVEAHGILYKFDPF